MRAHFAVSMLLLMTLATGLASAAREKPPRPVAMIRLEGAIDVPSQAFLERALARAEENGAQALLILLDTPGGLVAPMTGMTKAMLNSPVPTIVFVYPAGAYAMSAGTFVTMAANVAAMQPATSIGAAHPVELLGGTPSPEGEKGAKQTEVMAKKIENAFSEQAKAIADRRGRNVTWAEKAVRESITASAKEAVKLNVVDLLAEDVPDLLAKVEGRQVALPGGRSAILRTAGAKVEEIEPTLSESFLHVLADPNMLLILLALAGLGIMFELQNPGAILPGVVGGIALLLALYSMSVIPINFAGVGLIVFGMLLFLAEVKVASHGILTVGGVISFVVGALMLTDVALTPMMRVSWQVVMVVTALLLAFFLFVIGASVRAHLRQVQTGREGMRGERGQALSDLTPFGEVWVEGERWRARAVDGEITKGEAIEVVKEEGLTLLVRKYQDSIPKGA